MTTSYLVCALAAFVVMTQNEEMTRKDWKRYHAMREELDRRVPLKESGQ